MVASGTLFDDCSSYGRFLQRFCDPTWAAYTFLPSMAEHGLKFARFAVSGKSHEYAIDPWAMAGAGESFAPLSTIRHLVLNIFPTDVSVMTGINLSGREAAVTLAQFINSAPQCRLSNSPPTSKHGTGPTTTIPVLLAIYSCVWTCRQMKL